MNHKISILLITVFVLTSILPAQPPRRKIDQASREIRQALEWYQQGDYERAESAFEQMLVKKPDFKLAKEMMALIGMKTGDVAQAEKFAMQAISQDRRSAPGYFVMAWVVNESGNKIAARDYLRKARRFASERFSKEEIDKFIESHRFDLDGEDDIPRDPRYERPAGSGKPYIAVFQFEDTGSDTTRPDLGLTAAEMLTTALIESDRFRVLERNQLKMILDEQALGMSGAVDAETAVDVGRLIGVDAVVIGTVSRLDERIELDSRMIDAGSGEAHTAAGSTADEESDLREAVGSLAEKFSENSGRIPVRGDQQ